VCTKLSKMAHLILYWHYHIITLSNSWWPGQAESRRQC